MKFRRALQRTVASRALFLSLALGVLTMAPGQKAEAQQQENMYLAFDLPIQFTFTGNISGTAAPSGFKATLHLPWRFGVAYQSYTVEATDSLANIDTELEIEMIDVMIDFDWGPIVIALGYGSGTVSMRPFTLSGAEFSTEDADASQIIVSLGWVIDTAKRWNFHLGYHMLEAETDFLVNGANSGSTIDLGGTMLSVGFSYWF